MNVYVSARTAIPAPAAFTLPAVEAILHEFGDPAHAALALNANQLGIPFEAVISVPVQARIRPGEGRDEWSVRICAAAHPALYPVFEGSLRLLRAAQGSELNLDGLYDVPFGAFGRALDRTVFHSAAEASLRTFLREIAHKVATLSRWSHSA
jgi:hypothetical protein